MDNKYVICDSYISDIEKEAFRGICIDCQGKEN